MTRKWFQLNHLSNDQYSLKKNINFKTAILRSDLFDAYIVVKGTTNLISGLNDDIPQKSVELENNAPFRSPITKISSILIDNAKDFKIVMLPIYNLLEYSGNYSFTSGFLWNYYRDKIDDAYNDVLMLNHFIYKTKIIGKSEVRPPLPPVPSSGGDQPP